MKNYIKLLRVKHYIKNFLIFIPMFFDQSVFDGEKVKNAIVGWLSFCFISSAVYVLNDLKDVEKDRMHPTKKNRPIACGAIKEKEAIGLLIVCIICSLACCIMTKCYEGFLFVGVYFLINILYSCGLKNKPLIDIIILTAGFVIRIYYGAVITNTEVSGWLFLVVVTGSIYMGLGKRRNELKKQTESREVLKYYTYSFLDKNMYVCVALVNVFYALWAMDFNDVRMIWTVPLFIIILMKYSLNIEGDSDGDPVEVIIHDKGIMAMTLCYAIFMFLLLYVL